MCIHFLHRFPNNTPRSIIWSLETTLLNRFVLRQRQFELSEEARYAHHGSGFTRESESYFGHHPELELTTIDDD